MDEEFGKRLFKEHLNKPGRWRESADKLKRGADILFAEHEVFCRLSGEEQAEAEDRHVAGVATLLYGLAMENMIKAALLRKGIARARPDGGIDWNADGATEHNLVSMCRSSQIAVLYSDEKLLERLSAFVCWAGKYPTPHRFEGKDKKDFKGLLLSDQPNAAKRMTPLEFNREDKDKFERIYKALIEQVSPIRGCVNR